MSLKKTFLKSKPICKVTFTLPQEAVNKGQRVKLVGDFNEWQWENGIPMKKEKGNYRATLDLKKDQEYQFRYLIDNQEWENDWEADDYQENSYGDKNSVVRT